MRAYPDQSRVSVSEEDIDTFTRGWPGSGLDGLRGVSFYFDRGGNIEDISFRNGNSDRWDGPDLEALAQDAHEFLRASADSNLRAELRSQFSEKRRFPWWWPTSWPKRERVEKMPTDGRETIAGLVDGIRVNHVDRFAGGRTFTTRQVEDLIQDAVVRAFEVTEVKLVRNGFVYTNVPADRRAFTTRQVEDFIRVAALRAFEVSEVTLVRNGLAYTVTRTGNVYKYVVTVGDTRVEAPSFGYAIDRLRIEYPGHR